jgi:GGDEF domain-containing protein
MAVEKLNEGSADYHLSLCVGALLCDKSMAGLSFDELMAKADALMYQKKRMQHAEAGAGTVAGR